MVVDMWGCVRTWNIKYFVTDDHVHHLLLLLLLLKYSGNKNFLDVGSFPSPSPSCCVHSSLVSILAASKQSPWQPFPSNTQQHLLCSCDSPSLIFWVITTFLSFSSLSHMLQRLSTHIFGCCLLILNYFSLISIITLHLLFCSLILL